MRLRKGPVRRLGPRPVRGAAVGEQERDAVGTFVAQLRTLLTSENPASDPAVARLFPPALPDDVLANLEYEQHHGDELLLGKLEALDTVERTLAATEVTEDELIAWLGSLNSIRLVVGHEARGHRGD